MGLYKRIINIVTITTGGLLALTLLSGAILSSPLALADNSATNDITINVPISCNLSSSTTTNHTATVDAGTYRSEIGESTITATCNDSDGFAIYAIGYTGEDYGNNTLKHTTDNTLSIASGTATSGATSNWAMKLTAVTGTYEPTIETTFQGYTTIPTTYTKVASHASVTDQTNGASFKSTYAAYIAPTQTAGTYEGKVKYTLVHPANHAAPYTPQAISCPSGYICYNANTNEHEGTMGQQSVASSDTSATLLASNFSRTGYGFAGWSDKFDYSAGAHFYGPQETISFTEGQYSGNNNGLSLYAVWVKSAGSLQDFTKVATLCGTGTGSLTQAPIDETANLSSVSALTDNRDNQTYAIAKLADGKCWMIENLRLDNTAELTLANTNNPLNDGTNVILKHNYTDTDTYNTLSATSSDAYDATNAPNGWCSDYSASCEDQSRLRTDNTANRATGNPNANTDPMYSYGNYYNWYSATAGYGTDSKQSGEVAGDLCPAGWRLPYGGNVNTVGGFYYLNYKLNNYSNVTNSTASNKLRGYPNNFIYSGEVYSSSVDYRGTIGIYWSSTSGGADAAYHLAIGSSYVNPGTSNYYKYKGRIVRCVAVLNV